MRHRRMHDRGTFFPETLMNHIYPCCLRRTRGKRHPPKLRPRDIIKWLSRRARGTGLLLRLLTGANSQTAGTSVVSTLRVSLHVHQDGRQPSPLIYCDKSMMLEDKRTQYHVLPHCSASFQTPSR